MPCMFPNDQEPDGRLLWGRWWHLGAVLVDSSLCRGGLLLEKRTGRRVVAVEEPEEGSEERRWSVCAE